jgi:predicted nucleic acid-binding Zn ribbon protein
VPEEADWQRSARLAADALAEAKADARARGDHPATGGRTRQPRAAGGSPVPGGSPGEPGEPGQGDGPAAAGRAAPGGPRRRRGGRARREDPQPLSTAFDGLLADQGWRTAAAVGSVFGRWDQLVGPDVAAHTRPERFSDGELVVIADSSAWATQVRLLTSAVLRRLNEELGHGTVTRVVVRGPAPPRRMGPLRVRGSREHTGDYG